MITINRDLQATYQILMLLEQARSGTDSMFDLLPGVLAVIDADGNILKGNYQLGKLLGVDHEKLVGVRISNLFKPDTWNAFKMHLGRLTRDRMLAESDFPLPVDAGSDLCHYLWHVTRFQPATSAHPDLFTLVGKDITELRRTHAQLFALERDLEVTRAVQALLLPRDDSYESKDFKLAASFECATRSGGDWWNFDVSKDGKIRIFLGDVSGHGAGAAMVTAAVAGAYRAVKAFEPEKIFEVLNANLRDLCNDVYWMTMSVVEVDPARQELCWWSAGAPPVFLMSPSGEVETLVQTSQPLGSGTLAVKSETRPFGTGSRIMLYSDGLHDFGGKESVRFGRQQLKKMFASTRELDPLAARDAICGRLSALRDGAPIDDDATFVVLDRL